MHQKYAEVSRPHITFTSPTPSYSYTGAPFSALSNIFYVLLSVLCVNETCMMQVLVNKDDRKGKEFSDFSILRRKRLLLKKRVLRKYSRIAFKIFVVLETAKNSRTSNFA